MKTGSEEFLRGSGGIGREDQGRRNRADQQGGRSGGEKGD